MASKLRKVILLGAFEISAELNLPVRDGLIIGSQRDQKGFVIETTREHIELIVASSQPAVLAKLPKRLPLTIGDFLLRQEMELVRLELRSVPGLGGAAGHYVQGVLVARNLYGKIQRLEMAATEGLQVALSVGLPLWADTSLLMLDVSQFLREVESFTKEKESENQEFKSFVDTVTASDFAKYLRKQQDEQ